MISKLISIYALLVFCCSNHYNVEAFELADFIKWPINKLSEKLLNWNPFKIASPVSNPFRDHETALYEWNMNITDEKINSTIIQKYYNYGCDCKNYSCSCCGHIEVKKINLNETGLIF